MRLLIAFALSAVSVLAQGQARIIARLSPGTTPASVAVRYGISLHDYTASAPFALYIVPPALDPIVVQAQMNQDAAIAWADDDDVTVIPEHSGGGKGGSIAAIADRNSLYAENGKMLHQISWTRERAESAGRPVRVAILDNGLSLKQPKIWLNVVANINYCEPGQVTTDWPRNQDTNGNGIRDEALGHGTMVAGIVHQMAPKCPLIIVRVADSDGVATAWNIVKGMAFAVVNQAEVVNISLGAVENIPALNDLLDWAVEEKNLVVVAPIGNNGAAMALSPSSSSKVACTSGLDPYDRKALFSNWDSKAIVSAPATGVKSFWWNGRSGIWSGTSFASPMVAAAVADAFRRRTTRAEAGLVLDAIEESGDTLVDILNPAYQGKLGLRLNCRRLDERIRALPNF